MPTKIRLTRHGRKKSPYYHIVIADSRAPRDGRYIERIGMYNPTTNPATIELDFDRALDWLQKGAQPTDTCRAILSYNGVLLKSHLLNGVKKGAFSEEEAETRYKAWLKDKEIMIQTKKSKVAKDLDDEEKKRLEAEKKIREAKAAELAEKNTELAEKEKAEAAKESPEEAPEEKKDQEASKEETAEKLKEEKKDQEASEKETPEKLKENKKEEVSEDKIKEDPSKDEEQKEEESTSEIKAEEKKTEESEKE
ncbi:MAG: 30S ribosomal protein S16 [Bacteroidetes bacterium]|nr:30S ribosomal protein S16 [Bacteroidota bacterium]